MKELNPLKLKYILKEIPFKQQALCIGDLLRYHGESKYGLAESIDRIASNKGLAVKLLNTIRSHSGMSGMTIDSLINQLQVASGIDIFKFTVNGEDLSTVFKDTKEIELDVYMNPVYFTTKGALTQYLPGIRRKKAGNDAVLEQAKFEQEKWIRWFERELCKYHPQNRWEKKIISLD